MILFGPAFLRFWVGPESAGPAAQLLPWLVVAYWILSLNSVSYYLLLGMGRIRLISLTVITAGICAVIAAYFAIDSIGLVGAPAGRAAYAIVSLALFIPVLQQLRNERDEIDNIPTINSVPGGDRLS
jgi:O-antigen/teichoic acid export membrane protein